MAYQQRESSRRKGLVGGKQVVEDLGLKPWAEVCRARGIKATSALEGTTNGRSVIIWLIKIDKGAGIL